MSKVYLKDSTLTAIGNAIRGKTGESGLLLPSEMANAIASITGGGSGSSLILPEAGDKIWTNTTGTSQQHMSVPSDIDPNNVKLIVFTTHPGATSASPDYYSDYFYIPGLCKHWVESSGRHNFSLIANGSSTLNRYGYGGTSWDLNGAGNYAQYLWSESASYPQKYCYLTWGDGQIGGSYQDSPLSEGYEMSNSDINFGTITCRRGPFVILYK